MGRFADAHIDDLSDAELDEFEQLMEVPDRSCWPGSTGAVEVPAEYDTALFRRLRDFHLSGVTDGEDAGEVSRRTSGARPPADAGQRRRRRRGPGRSPISRARSRRGRTRRRPALLVICRDGPRMAALARALAFFAPDIEVLQFPAWDCLPYDRVSPHAGVVAQRMTALSRLARVKGRDKPAVLLTTVNAALQRVPARDLDRASRRCRPRPATCSAWTASSRWLELNGFIARLDRARARRLRGARRHPRPVRAGHGRCRCGSISSATRWRRSAAFDPETQRTRPDMRALDLVPVAEFQLTHRDDPPLPPRLCRGVRRADARRPALRGGQRRPPLSRHGALAAAVPRAGSTRCSTICRARRSSSSRWRKMRRASGSRRSPTITRRGSEALADATAGAPYKPLPPDRLYLTEAEWARAARRPRRWRG